MTAIVRVWLPRGDAYGHSSLESSHSKVYISWWPKSAVTSPTDLQRAEQVFNSKVQGALAFLGRVVGEPNSRLPNEVRCSLPITHTLEEDLASSSGEGRNPDHSVRLDGLDEDAIKRWWDNFPTDHLWCTATTNCAAVVIQALRAGGADNYVPTHYLPKWTKLVPWPAHPITALLYALEVLAGLRIASGLRTAVDTAVHAADPLVGR